MLPRKTGYHRRCVDDLVSSPEIIDKVWSYRGLPVLPRTSLFFGPDSYNGKLLIPRDGLSRTLLRGPGSRSVGRVKPPLSRIYLFQFTQPLLSTTENTSREVSGVVVAYKTSIYSKRKQWKSHTHIFCVSEKKYKCPPSSWTYLDSLLGVSPQPSRQLLQTRAESVLVLVLLETARRSVEVVLEPLGHQRHLLDPLRSRVRLSLLEIGDDLAQYFFPKGNVVVRLPH